MIQEITSFLSGGLLIICGNNIYAICLLGIVLVQINYWIGKLERL